MARRRWRRWRPITTPGCGPPSAEAIGPGPGGCAVRRQPRRKSRRRPFGARNGGVTVLPQPSGDPVLMLGAAHVITGHLAKFVSTLEPIRIEHILASCAVPNIFPAVEIGPYAYWDGLFS